MATYRSIVGQKIKKVTSDPSNPIEGQMWYNSTSGNLKVRLTVAASFFLVALVFLIFSPTWSKNNNILDDTVDWSQVVDDPDVHMTFNLLMHRDARWSADALLRDNAFAKRILEKKIVIKKNEFIKV